MTIRPSGTPINPAEKRRWFLERMHRGKGGAGSHWASLMIAERSPNPMDLAKLDLVYAVIGGVATAAYMPQRHTQDTDILLRASSIEASKTALSQLGAVRLAALQPEPGLGLCGEAWKLDGELLDIFWSAEPWADEAIATARQTLQHIVPLPYLVMMKMNAARGVDQGDLTRMLGFADEELLAQTRAVIGRHRPDLADDLERYIEIGRLEIRGTHDETDGIRGPALR